MSSLHEEKAQEIAISVMQVDEIPAMVDVQVTDAVSDTSTSTPPCQDSAPEKHVDEMPVTADVQVADAVSDASTSTPPGHEKVPALPSASKSSRSLRSSRSTGKLSFMREVALVVRDGIKKNRVPTCIAIVVGVTILALFYLVPQSKPFFQQVQQVETANPIVFSMISSVVCGGLIPMLLQVILTKRMPTPLLGQVLFILAFWTFLGVWVKGQYSVITWLFGSSVDAVTLVKKVAIDQFVISPFVNYVWITACFRFRDSRFSCSAFAESLRDRRSLLLQYFGMNICNWSTWMPGATIIFAMPTSLQMPIWAAIMVFYSSLLTLVSADASQASATDNEGDEQSAEEMPSEEQAQAAEKTSDGKQLEVSTSLDPASKDSQEEAFFSI
eukprot:TRINITY_DN9398_c0_g2_i1.p1 TRINITY_DN9398_c0_g2~~TRINITY_DN9398_c0_g2_i1.p1  ORF type:complete len:409 (-),score=69.72 TRINITY_DN9398_c0_g2_i1:293-1447(-)